MNGTGQIIGLTNKIRSYEAIIRKLAKKEDLDEKEKGIVEGIVNSN